MEFKKLLVHLSQEKIVFSTSGAGTIGYPHPKEWIGLPPHTICKSNSKWILDLNISATTKTILKENIGVNPYDLGLGNFFFR